MSIVSRIRDLLINVEKTPLKDASGKIITPAGAEAAIEAKGIRQCLKIAMEEEAKLGTGCEDRKVADQA